MALARLQPSMLSREWLYLSPMALIYGSESMGVGIPGSASAVGGCTQGGREGPTQYMYQDQYI